MSEPEPIAEPIEMLTGQEVEPARDLVGRVRRDIERRETVAQLASFSWKMPKVLLLELLQMMNPGKGRRA
jgi:Ni,Fe-hydrogenase III large subunit